MNVDQAFYELVRLVRRFQALGNKFKCDGTSLPIIKLSNIMSASMKWCPQILFKFFYLYLERPDSAAGEGDAYDGSRRRGGGGRRKCTIL